MPEPRSVAYFSMEMGLEAGMPTYSGGLGVLAADTVRAAADLKVPMVAVTLLHRKGYFRQKLDAGGRQREEPAEWVVTDYLEEMPQRAAVALEGRTVQLRAWRYDVQGVGGYQVPVYFLDADLPENADVDRTLTHFLYGGDDYYRLCQEVILGVGGVRMLRGLGYEAVDRYHMNEGHASLLTLELLEQEARKVGRRSITREDIEAVRRKCVFTTHTPVPAGHDQFPMSVVKRVLGHREILIDMRDVFCVNVLDHMVGHRDKFNELRDVFRDENALNLTYVALNLSHYVNGVAKKHGEVARLMFAGYEVDAITNGCHAVTWTAPPLQEVYDRHMPGWRQDNSVLRRALSIPRDEIWQAHAAAKKRLIEHVRRQTNTAMDAETLTFGFARRATAYKRWDLLFQDLGRLKQIAAKAGRFQLVYAGKAHPRDEQGKELIRRVLQVREALKADVKVAFLEDYDLELARMLTAGVDVWLNTPQPPLEASGTSGMKAALNGVPSLSVLDGWWIEGCVEGVTGWAVGKDVRGKDEGSDAAKHAASLYDKMEGAVVPLYYRDRDRFLDVMLHAIALNGSYFNAQRMMQQYVLNAYFR
jgi:starch phosphorylase